MSRDCSISVILSIFCLILNEGSPSFRGAGNTCYLNSALQTLMHLPPLVAYFSCPPDPRWAEDPDNMKFVLLHNFSILMRKTWNGRHSAIAPRSVLATMRSLNSFFRSTSCPSTHAHFLLSPFHTTFSKPVWIAGDTINTTPKNS